MPFSEPQALEFRDLHAVNAAIEDGLHTFDDLLDVVCERVGVPRGTAYGRVLRAALEKTERLPVRESNAELEAEVRECIRKNAFNLRLGRCLIHGWLGWSSSPS